MPRVGAANRVEFDGSKEHFVVLHRVRGHGKNFVLLGATYDTKLLMADHCTACAARCHWKVKTMRCIRYFYSTADFGIALQSSVLPVLEAHTSAVYHAAPTNLDHLDSVQRLFLHGVGLTEEEALLEYRLAPLRTRRDLAMLGLLHRCALKTASPQLLEFFPRAAQAT